MRLTILLVLLRAVMLLTLCLTIYNIGYEKGYNHGVLAGFFGFDRPEDVIRLEGERYVVCTKQKRNSF